MSKLPDPNPVVYRMYDATGRLLYIGSSIRLRNRLGTHRSSSWFWILVERICITNYQTLDEAEAAEVEAIRSEQPAFNTRSSGRPRYTLTDDDLSACREWLHESGWCRSGALPTWLKWVDDALDDDARDHARGQMFRRLGEELRKNVRTTR